MIYLKEDKCSFTALLCAYVRAYHARNDSPCLFDDSLAYDLIPEDTRASLEQDLVWNFLTQNPTRAFLYPNQAKALERIMRGIPIPPVVLGRARYVEDRLDLAVKNGVRQYVLLGAGMDTFAFRRPEMMGQVRVFEVDHPATQAFKRRRIAELGWQQPPDLHFIPIDFTWESLAAALSPSPYDPHSLGFFNWLGVTYYLPRTAVFANLRTIAEIAPPGSQVVFDYFDTDAQDPDKAARRVHWLLDASKQSEEPLLTCLDPAGLAQDLADVGLRLEEDLSPDNIHKRYFQGRTDGYWSLQHAHFATAVVA